MEWISVKKELPKEMQQVIISSNTMKGVQPGYYKNGQFWMYNCDFSLAPSHWMPLPKPPVA